MNLPISLKEIWLKEDIYIDLIKIPFGHEIKFFKKVELSIEYIIYIYYQYNFLECQ